MKIALIGIGTLAIVLLLAGLAMITEWPERIMLDFATVIAVIVAILLGEFLKREGRWLAVTSYSLIGIGVASSAWAWVR